MITYTAVERVGARMSIPINEKEPVISPTASVAMESIVCPANNGVERSVVSIGPKEVPEYNPSREPAGRLRT